MKRNRGFTLIELLVVIAIIGILSGIIITALSSARNKSKDARIKGDVRDARNLLEIGYSGSSYADLYTASGSGKTNDTGSLLSSSPSYSKLAALVADAANQGGAINFVANSAVGPATAISYAIYGKYVSGSTYFCMDSNGNVKDGVATNNTTICP